MDKNIIILFIIVAFFYFYLISIINKKDQKISSLKEEIYEIEKMVSVNDLRFITNEQKISIIEQALDPKSKRWAKVKQVRAIIQEEMKQSGLESKTNINEITEIASSLVDYSEEYNLKLSLILAISRRESHFNPLAVSPTQAQGIMQLLSSTAKECADDLGKKYFNLFKIRDNVQLGTWYMWKMLNRFKNNEGLAIRAYNAGPVFVEKVISGEISDYPEETKKYFIDVSESQKKYELKGL